MKVSWLALAVAAVVAFVAASPASSAAPIEVDTTSDALLTACTPAAGDCSLRGAITVANLDTALDDIIFSIDAGGPKTIIVGAGGSALPPITYPAAVHGLSQPGCVTACITLAPAPALVDSTADGLNVGVGASASSIDGLIITSFPDNGVEVTSSASATTISHSFIGTDATGTAVLGNGRNGVLLAGSRTSLPAI